MATKKSSSSASSIKWILLLIIFFAIGVGIGTAYQQKKDRKVFTQLQSDLQEKKAVTNADAYKLAAYNFSVNVPEGWALTEQDAAREVVISNGKSTVTFFMIDNPYNVSPDAAKGEVYKREMLFVGNTEVRFNYHNKPAREKGVLNMFAELEDYPPYDSLFYTINVTLDANNPEDKEAVKAVLSSVRVLP